ncbi:hypothetical protein ACRALDRAFT_211552 [Sodiomyces alcalophilus JCM 7366]|uniref:uncharacterized protein n=1 Tax=Sodiomyces alcalophilus JCM 7366 TaxID=591952 RepID=UPI0039B616B6
MGFAQAYTHDTVSSFLKRKGPDKSKWLPDETEDSKQARDGSYSEDSTGWDCNSPHISTRPEDRD